MATHSVRLLITALFFIMAVAGLMAGYALSGLFWLLAAFAVGYPFVRNGKIDLNYDDIIYVEKLPQ